MGITVQNRVRFRVVSVQCTAPVSYYRLFFILFLILTYIFFYVQFFSCFSSLLSALSRSRDKNAPHRADEVFEQMIGNKHYLLYLICRQLNFENIFEKRREYLRWISICVVEYRRLNRTVLQTQSSTYNQKNTVKYTQIVPHSHTLPPLPPHTLPLTPTPANSYPHTLSHSHTHTLSLSHTLTPTLSHSHTLSPSLSHTLSLSHAGTGIRADTMAWTILITLWSKVNCRIKSPRSKTFLKGTCARTNH